MKLLAFDTSTETLSIAVSRSTEEGVRTWEYSGVGGAKASTDLIATVLDLLRQAALRLDALDAICFGAGPGSFTGLRTACSVAQGLAFGANVPVLPVDTLLAVAETARLQTASPTDPVQITALLDARMDEMYAGTYAFDGRVWTEREASHLVRPEQFTLPSGAGTEGVSVPLMLAGNVFGVYAGRFSDSVTSAKHLSCLPGAVAMLRLAPALLAQGKAVSAEHALPLYVRDKVAKTTAERMAEKAAALPA